MLTGCIKRQHNLEAKLQKAQYALDHRRDDAVDFRRMGFSFVSKEYNTSASSTRRCR